MPNRESGVGQLRQLVRERVEKTSIRAVALEIGMSPSGLHVFLEGSRPHPATVRKISEWSKRDPGPRIPDSRDVDAAVDLLRVYLERHPRSARARKLAELVDRLS